MKQENKMGVWADDFLSGYSFNDYTLLECTARIKTNNFMRGVKEGTIVINDGLTPLSNDPELDAWVASDIGQNMLGALVLDMQNHIESVAHFALPAHDIRQIFFKDAPEGLRYADMEKPQGYKATFVIPMFGHDMGRLLEGRFFHASNPHDKWIPHAQLSFLMLGKILDKPEYREMPQRLKNHFLYAVLAHSGDNGQSYMSRAVQTCDRMQLIGAEGFFRALSYGLCLADAEIKYPEDEKFQKDLPNMYEHRSVISMLEYFSRNMRENIGDHHKSWQKRIAIENVAILMKLSEQDEETYAKIFAPELSGGAEFGRRKQPIGNDILAHAKELLHGFSDLNTRTVSPHDVSKRIKEMLECLPGTAKLTHAMQMSIIRAVNDMPKDALNSLNDALTMAIILRTEQDEIDRRVLLKMTTSPHSFHRQIAQHSLRYCPDPAMPTPTENTPNPFLMGRSLA